MTYKEWKNGKWVTAKQKGWGGSWGQPTTKGGKVLVDWACGICDQQADPAYLGNYANQNYCPHCKTEKRLACHMTMETRRARLKAGTLKPKAQARADREAKNNGTQKVDQGVQGDEEAENNKFHADLLKQHLEEKITKEQMKELIDKGRPKKFDSNSQGGQNQGGLGGTVGGDQSTGTKPGDFAPQDSWNKAGPTPAELKKKLDSRKKLLKDAEKDGGYDEETLEKLRTQVKEAEDKHQASLPAATKLSQHDKTIGDIKWYLDQCRQQMGHAQEQEDWWRQQIDSKTKRQEVLVTELGKAEDAKKEFMMKEGIQETIENTQQEQTPKFELFTQQAQNYVFEKKDDEESKKIQSYIFCVQDYFTKQAEARRVELQSGGGANEPEEISDDEGPEEDEDADEAELMEDIKQHAAKLPTQTGKDSNQPVMLSVEENAKLRKEAKERQKERKEKEGKTVRSSKAIGKKHLKQSGKKHGLTLAAKKDQDAAEEGK